MELPPVTSTHFLQGGDFILLGVQLKYTAKQERGLVAWPVIGGGIHEGTSASYFLCSVLLVVLYKYQLGR